MSDLKDGFKKAEAATAGLIALGVGVLAVTVYMQSSLADAFTILLPIVTSLAAIAA